MGNRLREKGAQHVTHEAYFRNMRMSRASLLIIENVTEYEEALVQRELGAGWKLVSERIDPRIFGLPACRARVYMICWRVSMVRWTAPFTLASFLSCLRSQVVMDISNYFYMNLPKTLLTESAAPETQ